MRTITITTITGVCSEVNIDSGNEMVSREYDGFKLSPELYSWKNIRCITNGIKHYLRDFYIKDTTDMTYRGLSQEVIEALAIDGVYGIACGHSTDNKYIILLLDEKNYTKTTEEIDLDEQENTTSDAFIYIQSQKEIERQKEISWAKNILKKSESTIKIDGGLMTNIEASTWQKNYNNVANEGGEGYVPNIITSEQVALANKILNEL